MSKFIFTIIILYSLFFNGCSLERSNPLDPKGNSDITEPRVISGFTVRSSNSIVYLNWDRIVDQIAHYNVYRSLQYDGVFEFRFSVPQSETSAIIEITETNVQLEAYYYYKVSAVNLQGLEGRLCEPKGVRVRK